MKKLLLSAFVAFAMLASTKTLAQQGFGTNTPSKSAAVDIVSSQRGLLVPRLALTQTTDQAPIPASIAPATSLFVYNTATVNDVIPGFYYWDGAKWVRFVSSSSEKNTVVTAGKNVEVNSSVSTDGLTTTYNVAIAEGTAEGQVLVTKETTPGVFTSEWVNPDDFIKGVNGIDVTTDPITGVTNVGLGGALNKDTEINTAGNDLSITGLPILTTITTEKVMVMDATGILKQVSLSDLLAAKDLILENELEFTNSTTGVGAVLVETQIGIKDKSVGSEKLDPGISTVGQIATVVETTPGDATTKVVQYQDASTAIGKTLTTDNIIGVGADAASATASSLNGAVLTPTYLKIKDNSITALQIGTGAVGNDELAVGAVTADKMQSKDTATAANAVLGTVPVADGNGGVTYQTVASAVGENLTTDGKIVIGSTNVTTLADAVLVPTHLKIAPESITSADIKDGTIQATDLKAPGTTTDSNTGGTVNQMLVTDAAGNVSWQPQSGVAMAGDVTGTTGANEISKLQGVNVAAKDTNAPADGEVLTYDDSTKTWTPKTVAEASGKGLTTDSVIEITGTGATTISSATQSVLKDITLSIGTDKITADHIAENAVGASELADNAVASANIINGTIKAEDIQAPGSTTDNNLNGTGNQVMVTNSSGAVTWVNQTDLPSNTVMDDGINTTVTGDGSAATPFEVNVATASGTTLGVVKQSAATGEEITIATDGSLSINEANVTLTGDVTGALNDTNVGAIQGTAVSNVAPTNNQVLTYNGTAWTPTAPTSLVLVDNGISKATDGDVILGGTLNEPATTIITGGASNTLAFEGLIVPAAATTEIMYAEGSTGILRKAVRSISQEVTASQTVSAITGYNDFVQEINVTATIGGADIDITLPAASTTNKGQVVTVKIGNTTEPANYVNIISGATTLTYGALPYQGWIVKSNGSAWEIVGRN